MQVKPSKSRSISIVKGKVVDKRFFINGEAIPTVSETFSANCKLFKGL